MEEATERLVRLYLESKGFFVRTSYKVKIEKNRVLEADVMAIRISNKHHDKLPNAIMAEVKAWPISPNGISDLFKKSESKLNFKRQKQDASKLKLVNNQNDRKQFFEKLKKEFGLNFSFFLITKKMRDKHEKILMDFFKRKHITFKPLEEIAEGVLKYALREKYSNDSELQLIRLLNKERKLLRVRSKNQESKDLIKLE
ncbi:MAG TPA: hypothetical protein VJJ72_00245 [Candidatus Paceibacterota bacterium]